jgi:hypothetical protein
LLSKSSSFLGGWRDAAFWALSEEAALPSGKWGRWTFWEFIRLAPSCAWDNIMGISYGRGMRGARDCGLVLLPVKHDSEGVSVGHGVDVIEGMRDRNSKTAVTQSE